MIDDETRAALVALFEHLIVNDDLEQAKQALLGIALAERHRRGRLAARAEALLKQGAVG